MLRHSVTKSHRAASNRAVLGRSRISAAILAATAAAAVAGPCLAGNWTLRDYGEYTPAEAHKAQSYIKSAMTESMDKAAALAAEIHADDMLDYGLGLALGRAPATTMIDTSSKSRMQDLFDAAMSVYDRDLTKNGKTAATGYDPAALDQADFWIWMSRMLSYSQTSSVDVSQAEAAVNPNDPNGEAAAVNSAQSNSSTMTAEAGDFSGPDGRMYDLKGDLTVLEPRVVSAAHACADYAYTAARMQRFTELDPEAVPHVTPDKMRDLQAQAAQLVMLASKRGPEACGDEAFFDQVRLFAEGHLGKLASFKLARQAAAEPGAAPAPSNP